jgi:hypothetical protein
MDENIFKMPITELKIRNEGGKCRKIFHENLFNDNDKKNVLASKNHVFEEEQIFE